MKRNRKHRRYRLANRRKFFIFVLALIAIILIIATATTSSSGSDPVSVNAAGTGGMPEQKTIYVPQPYTEAEVEMLAKTVYGEALVTYSETEMSAVVWCILNRVDATGYACGNSIEYVITYPGQFAGYAKSNPVTPEIDALVRDVLDRWYAEKKRFCGCRENASGRIHLLCRRRIHELFYDRVERQCLLGLEPRISV